PGAGRRPAGPGPAGGRLRPGDPGQAEHIGAHPGRARLPHHRPLADARRPARRPQCRPARRPPGLTGRTLSPTVRARIGIDTGGTFTDLVLLDEAGRAVRLKVPSTPAD